jgi:hypothetical protein
MRRTTYEILIQTLGVIKETLKSHAGEYLIALRSLEQCEQDTRIAYEGEKWDHGRPTDKGDKDGH